MDTIRVREFFEQVAGKWDDLRSAWYDEKVIEELARRVSASPTNTVMDVGTGTGFVAAGLAHRVRHVIAVDNSTAMLDVARRNLDHLAINNVELREADLGGLPYPDGCVDAAVANMVLHHAMDPAAMVQEMARVTKAGGWVAITDAVEHSYEWMRTEHADVWLGFNRDQIASFFSAARLEQSDYTVLGTR